MNTKSLGAHGALTWCLLLTTGCSGPDPDPRAIARELFRDAPLVREPALRPLVASIDVFAAAPAPIAEPRLAPALPRRATILIGNDAVHAIDDAFGDRFAATSGEVICSRATSPDRDAIERMLQGRGDLAVIAGTLSSRDQHAGLRQTRLGIELWALAVAETSPLRTLTRTQVRQVLTGAIHDFGDLGQARGALAVYVPTDRGQVQRAAKSLMPGDPLAATSIPVDERDMLRALANPGAIGVVRVGASRPSEGIRLLQIDWSPPTLDTFKFGTYPFGTPITLVTSGQPTGIASDFLAFANGNEGRALLGRSLLVGP